MVALFVIPTGALDTTFEPKDSLLILHEIIEVKARSDIFGRLLQLGRLRVNLIHREFSDPQDRLLQVIDEFIRQADEPTWRVIINALRRPLLNHNKLALEIERKYAGKQSKTMFIVYILKILIPPGEEISALDERSQKSGNILLNFML